MGLTADLNVRTDIPVWFMDVDGVINSFGELSPAQIQAHGQYRRVNILGYPIWWSPAVVDFINEVSRAGLVEVVWLTTWTQDAVDHFAPKVGLDKFPAITDMSGGEYPWLLDWWKWRAVRDFLGDNGAQRRVVWTDDDLGPRVKEAFQYRYGDEHSLLLAPQSVPGLTQEDLAAVRAFLELVAPRG